MAQKMLRIDDDDDILLGNAQLVGTSAHPTLNGYEVPFNDSSIRGSQGDKGDTGDKGDIGATGPVGDTGPIGEDGEKGPIGSKGDTGPDGPQGDQGIEGPKGDTGPQGPKGDTGDPADQIDPSNNDTAWYKIWSGVAVTGDTVQLPQSYLQTVDSNGVTWYHSELLFIGRGSGSSAYVSVSTVVLPVYVLLEGSSTEVQCTILPSDTASNYDPMNYNTVVIPVQDGLTNAYNCFVYLKTDTTQIGVDPSANTEFIGLYAKRGFSSEDGFTIL